MFRSNSSQINQLLSDLEMTEKRHHGAKVNTMNMKTALRLQSGQRHLWWQHAIIAGKIPKWKYNLHYIIVKLSLKVWKTSSRHTKQVR